MEQNTPGSGTLGADQGNTFLNRANPFLNGGFQ
jgi:hypothetical protein